jgi:formylglycine-generating enzyme required for sulfatase activity
MDPKGVLENESEPRSGGLSTILRGGDWLNNEWACRSASRIFDKALTRSPFRGFRVAASLPDVLLPEPSEAPPESLPHTSPPPPAIAPFDATQARVHQEAWAKHLGIEIETTNSIGQTLVVIPPGEFTMGDGRSTTQVTFTQPILMAKTEVTQGQWRDVMGTAPWKGSADTFEGDDVAAWSVSLEDAKTFCTKLTERERGAGKIGRDQTYRLPVAAEWEYACRAGTQTKYFFGDDASRLKEYAWFRENADRGGAAESADQSTATGPHAHRVSVKKPNQWGLFDMHGNVWERCDAWSTDHPQSIIEPAASKGAGFRHSADAFGGCWNSQAAECGSAVRFSVTGAGRAVDIGLRVVLSAPTLSRQGDSSR